MATDLYAFSVRPELFRAVVLDGRGNVVTIRNMPLSVSRPGRWLDKTKKWAALLGELCRAVGRQPTACSVCGREWWNDDELIGTTQPDAVFCNAHSPPDGTHTYPLGFLRKLQMRKTSIDRIRRMMELSNSVPIAPTTEPL